MTIQQAIESAIKGGYSDGKAHSLGLSREIEFGDKEFIGINDLVLDPNFWKALGKSEGWWNEIFIDGGKVIEEDFIKSYVNKSYAKDLYDRICKISEAQYKMNKMIDALWEGKSVEEYLSEL